jgi:hypothetical protein
MSWQSCQSCIIIIDFALYKGRLPDRNRETIIPNYISHTTLAWTSKNYLDFTKWQSRFTTCLFGRIMERWHTDRHLLKEKSNCIYNYDYYIFVKKKEKGERIVNCIRILSFWLARLPCFQQNIVFLCTYGSS